MDDIARAAELTKRSVYYHFASKAELSLEYVSPTLIMLSRPPRLTFNFRDADIKVVIDFAQ